MNNTNLTNENALREGVPINCTTANFPNNSDSSEQSTAFSATGYASQLPPFQPSNFYSQPPYNYGFTAQIHPQFIPPVNQLQQLPQENQCIQYGQHISLGFPAQLGEFQHVNSGLNQISHIQQLTPPGSVLNQESVLFNAPQQEQLNNFPNEQQIYFPQLTRNVFSSASTQGLYSQQPVVLPGAPFDPSTVLQPSIRQCISFPPPDVSAHTPHSSQEYQEFVAGLQGITNSKKVESQNPNDSNKCFQSRKPLPEEQVNQITQTSSASHVAEVPVAPSSTTELNKNKSQLFEVTFNLSGQDQTCKVAFSLENSLCGPNGIITASVSSNVNINELLKKEDGIENNLQPIESTAKEGANETETSNTTVQATLSEIQQERLIDKQDSTEVPSTPKSDTSCSSSQDSLLNDASATNPFLASMHEENYKDEKVESSE